MDKAEALKRIADIEAEAAKLRAIVTAPDKPTKLVYDGHKMYVFVDRYGSPYLLAGGAEYSYFMWFRFGGRWLTEESWNGRCTTGQEALDSVADHGKVYEFTNGLKGLTFFFNAYKAHKA